MDSQVDVGPIANALPRDLEALHSLTILLKGPEIFNLCDFLVQGLKSRCSPVVICNDFTPASC